MRNQVKHDPGRQPNNASTASTRPMRLLGTMSGSQMVAPVVQRNIGVWLGLALILVILGLDIVGGGNAELLGLLVSPPIVAASFVGPKRTAVVGLVALAAGIGYGRVVGVDLLAGSQGVPPVAIVAATVLSALVARLRIQRERRLRAVTRVAEVAQRALLGPRTSWPRCTGCLPGGARPGKPPPSPHRFSRHRPRCPWASAGRGRGVQGSACRSSLRHSPTPRRSPGRFSCHAARGADRPPSPSCSVPIHSSSAAAAARDGPKPEPSSRRSGRSKNPHSSPRPDTRWLQVSTLAEPELHAHIATPAGWFLREDLPW